MLVDATTKKKDESEASPARSTQRTNRRRRRIRLLGIIINLLQDPKSPTASPLVSPQSSATLAPRFIFLRPQTLRLMATSNLFGITMFPISRITLLFRKKEAGLGAKNAFDSLVAQP